MSPEHTTILKSLTRHFSTEPALVWDPAEEGPAVGCAYFPAETTNRPWGTLCTFGMSLTPMIMDERADEADTKRAEIITYVNADETELDVIANCLCWTGAFPFLQDPVTFLGWGHTIHMDQVFRNSSLTTLLTLTSIVKADNQPVFKVENDPVGFLWLTFLTDAEYVFKKEKGVNALLDLFADNNHPVALDRNRISYV